MAIALLKLVSFFSIISLFFKNIYVHFIIILRGILINDKGYSEFKDST